VKEGRKEKFILFSIEYVIHIKKKLKVPFDFVCLMYGWMYVENESVERKKKKRKRFNMSFECIYIYILQMKKKKHERIRFLKYQKKKLPIMYWEINGEYS